MYLYFLLKADLYFWRISGRGRPDLEDDPQGLCLTLKHIFLSNVFARHIAKAHNAGLFEFTINKITKSYLDWYYAALNHVYCIMSPRVLANLNRMTVSFFLSLILLCS